MINLTQKSEAIVKGITHHLFSSQRDFMSPTASETNSSLWVAYMRHHSNTSSNLAWWGVLGGRSEVVSLTENGWAEGTARVSRLAEKLTGKLPAMKVSRRKSRRGPSGGDYDIHSALSGNFDKAWRRMERVKAKGKKKIHLVIDIVDNAKVKSEAVFWNIAASLVLAKRYVKAGYTVKITASYYAENLINSATPFLAEITMKNYDRPVNLDSLSILALSGFFRYYGLKSCAALEAPIKSSFGRAARPPLALFARPGEETVLLEKSPNEAAAIKTINRHMS